MKRRWEVLPAVEGKTKGIVGTFGSCDQPPLLFYQMDPTRSADVPIAHFADLIANL